MGESNDPGSVITRRRLETPWLLRKGQEAPQGA